MMAENKIIPEIRFAGFTDAWEQRKLDEFVSFFSGLTYSPADIRPAGTLVLRSSNVKDGEVVDADNVYVDPTVVNSENVRDGDIIVVVRNGSRALIGKHAEIKGFKPNTVIGAFMTGIRSEHPSFLNALLNTPRFDKEVEMNMGATINQITGYMFSKMEFMVPSSDEQDIIGDYFKKLDNLITLHQREESCAASFSASCFGTLKAFFWEQRKFSDFVLRESVFQASSSEYPSVEYEDVVAEEGRLNKDIRQKETQKTGIVFDGTQVLYGKLRPYLHNWLNPDFTGVAVGDWWVLRPVGADKKFLYRLIQTQQFDEVANQSSGSKMPRADWNLVSNTEFIIPSSLDEQRQIAGTFDDLDNLITLHQCKPKSRKGGSHVLYSYQV